MYRFMLTLLLASFCLAFGAGLSIASDGITYQAEVRQDGNVPTDGNYFFRFELYDALEGGSALWSQEDSLQVTSGVVNTVFEGLNPSWFQTYPELYLEVTLNNEPLGARTRLEAVPYAFVARHAAVADSCTNCGGGSGGDSVWEVNPSGIHYNGGNVGIGTETPVNPLHVDGQGIDWAGKFTNSNGESSIDLRLGYKTGAGIFMQSTGISGGYLMHLLHEGATRLYLTKPGYLGIGTNSPTSPLHVVGDIYSQDGRVLASGIPSGTSKLQSFRDNGTSSLGTWISPENPDSKFAVLNGDDGLYFTTDWDDNNHFIAYSNMAGIGLGVDTELKPRTPSVTLALRQHNTGFQYLSSGTSAYFANGIETVRFSPTMMTVTGDLCVTGQKNRIVETPYGTLAMNAEESSEAWFSTSGESRLVDGRARIELSSHFLATVTISDAYPMQVSATFYGAHGGGWYVERGLNGFTLVDPSGSNAPFTWTVKARQKGYEDVNLRVVSTTEGR